MIFVAFEITPGIDCINWDTSDIKNIKKGLLRNYGKSTGNILHKEIKDMVYV